MRGLTVIVATADADCLGAALTLANAQAALGGRARVYFHQEAVRSLAEQSELMDIARDFGVELIACQTGLAAAGIMLPARVEGGGMVSLLATLEDDRLVVV